MLLNRFLRENSLSVASGVDLVRARAFIIGWGHRTCLLYCLPCEDGFGTADTGALILHCFE